MDIRKRADCSGRFLLSLPFTSSFRVSNIRCTSVLFVGIPVDEGETSYVVQQRVDDRRTRWAFLRFVSKRRGKLRRAATIAGRMEE